MYIDDDLTHRTKEELVNIIRSTHQALAALLWLVDDFKIFDDLLYESHFGGSVPLDRAQYVERVLATRCVDDIVAGERLTDADCSGSYGLREFASYVQRCEIARSFIGGEKLFADLITDEEA